MPDQPHGPDLSALTTESVDDRHADLDTLSTLELAVAMNAADAAVTDAVEAQLDAIVAVVEGVTERLRRGGRLVYAGAGTAGRLGVLDASECPPTFDTDPSLVVGLIAGGEVALTTAVEGAEDDRDLAIRDLDRIGLTDADTLVGLSASGRTPYTVEAVAEARRRGALAVGFACNQGSPLAAAGDLAIEVVVGPELVAGSTRLKSGTAQKLVLNMISTMVMVRLGKTYGNLMVDVRATNDKLRARAHRIVTTITGAPPQDVERALDEHGGRAKPAALALLTGLAPAQVDAALTQHHGDLRATLTALTKES
ncbi:N-acetylmuramic acid 6-phosphate etherase [Arsenicicoccus bolidensis]|uniref:N-acetylmuramic acid 6-phosphate etherase n=1 Tax=Arsenicicoccus bolidensis TaxID=229480 RepID=UPI0004243157|nr:N-acetylmuramic acid 6-phosphate etherase [Arsenicicoccus bolidensis]